MRATAQYTDDDLDRLTRILYYRDLGFALDAIAALLDAVGGPRTSTCGGSTSC